MFVCLFIFIIRRFTYEIGANKLIFAKPIEEKSSEMEFPLWQLAVEPCSWGSCSSKKGKFLISYRLGVTQTLCNYLLGLAMRKTFFPHFLIGFFFLICKIRLCFINLWPLRKSDTKYTIFRDWLALFLRPCWPILQFWGLFFIFLFIIILLSF